MKIFVLNSGGSSVKFKLLEMPEEKLLSAGKVERLGRVDAVFDFIDDRGKGFKRTLPVSDHKEAIKLILDSLVGKENAVLQNYEEIDAVGHRVVHAGEKFTGSVMINDRVIAVLKDCFELAPLHNPPNVTGIEICQDLLPGTPMTAVFDNAFHAGISDYIRTYAIPYRYYQKYGVRRYGFHGITFEYMTRRASEILGKDLEELKLVSLMLGSGCTANAFKDGRSVEVSTGFTPLEGLVQSTRSGDVDPAAVLYIMRKENLSPEQMDQILNKESGWKGVSGLSSDLRDIIEDYRKGNKMAELAIRMTVHRARKYLGAYSAIMGGIDALVFSGGIGENSALLREKICADLGYISLELDEGLNETLEGEGVISTPDSKTKVLVVNTDEELVIARNTYKIVNET
ncbi:MAG: acetate kinase [Firmicutes bacterium]|nr:acetate kinase [Bacillota bacterium]